MSDPTMPAGLDHYILCPGLGCSTRVFSVTGHRNPCRAHGGSGTYPELPYDNGLPLALAAERPPRSAAEPA